MEWAKVAYSPVRWDFAIVQDQDNIQVVVMIAEHLSMRPLILQHRLGSAGVCCIYIYIFSCRGSNKQKSSWPAVIKLAL